MVELLFYTLECSLLILILYTFFIITFKEKADKEKNSTFECGFDQMGPSRLVFCIKFFLIGIIFLVFDVEVSLIIPIPFGQHYLLLFILVLLVGLRYEWFYGGLE